MNIMESRYIHLAQSLQGLYKTGIPLIEYNGASLIPAKTWDDLGIYIFIPKIALWLGISIDQAINIFFYGLIGVAIASAFIAYMLLYKTWVTRSIALVYISGALWYALSNLEDVYIAYFVCPMIIIPWCLYAIRNIDKTQVLVYYVVAGIVIGFMHYIRSYAGLASLLFVIVSTLMHNCSWVKKMVCYGALSIGLMMPVFYFHSVYNNFLEYSRKQLQIEPTAQLNHVMWHTIYVGFGFLNYLNDDNIRYDDTVARDKVLSVDPAINLQDEKRYDAILKEEVFKLINRRQCFVLFTIFAKLGVLFYYLLRYANLGFVALFFRRFQWAIDLPFMVSLAASSIFPLIAIPTQFYTAGFSTFAILYAIVSINAWDKQRIL